MNKPKIIFFDVDGTLVPLKGAARPRTLEALRRLHQNGIRLCIATGRAPMEVPKFEGVSFDAFLTYNGSYCFTPEQDIFKNTIYGGSCYPHPERSGVGTARCPGQHDPTGGQRLRTGSGRVFCHRRR